MKPSPRPKEADPRIQNIVKKRHRNVLTALKLEDYFSKGLKTVESPDGSITENPEVESDTDEILLQYRQSAGANSANGPLLFSFVSGQDKVRSDILRAMEMEAYLKDVVESWDEEFNPEYLGIMLFYHKTKKHPLGKVTAHRDGPFFVYHFQMPEDYNRFRGRQAPACEDEEGDEEKAVSSGAFRIARAEFMTPLPYEAAPEYFEILINEDVNQDPSEISQTLIHERQHYINSEPLSSFLILESRRAVGASIGLPLLEARADCPDKRFRYHLSEIKNELLCNLREVSTSPTRCTSFLNNALYAHLLDPFITDEEAELRTLMDMIGAELEEILAMFTTQEERAVLVYHLADIPLPRIPAHLKRLRVFFKELYGNIMQFLPRDIHSGLTKVTQLRLRELHKEIWDEIGRVKIALLGIDSPNASPDIEDSINTLKRLCLEYDIRLLRGGLSAPKVTGKINQKRL
jgi:hypothetical protein